VNNETPALTAPPWLLQEISRTPREKAEPIDGFEPDSPSAIESAREWLVNHAPEAIENRGGDSTTYNVACRVKDFGITEETCFELMAEHWNPVKAIPPWSMGELEQKVANAYLYGTSPIGATSPEVQFGEVELEATELHETGGASNSVKKSRLFWRRFSEARARAVNPNTLQLIKKFLGHGEMSVLYGDSNTGKTFVALDLCYHIATKQEWNGRKIGNSGVVVYVAAEAGESINARIEALARRYQPETETPLVVVPCMVNLFSPNADLGPLLELCAKVAETYGLPIVTVVLDTLARVMGPGDENSARDMGQLVLAADRIRVQTGAHVMIVHHSGKNKANGARGSSALRAATDTELEIEGGRVIMRKQRNGEVVKPIPFRLDTVVLGQDADGDSVTSCTVAVGASVDFTPQPTPEQEEWLGQIQKWANKQANETGSEGAFVLTVEVARDVLFTTEDRAVGSLVGPTGRPTTRLAKTTAGDRLRALVGTGRIQKDNNNQCVITGRPTNIFS
jgi:hypothetical protein